MQAIIPVPHESLRVSVLFVLRVSPKVRALATINPLCVPTAGETVVTLNSSNYLLIKKVAFAWNYCNKNLVVVK